MPSVPAAARIRGFATGVTDAGDLIGEPLIVVPADPHGDGGGASGVVVPSGLPAVVAAVWNGPGPPPPLAPDGPDVALTVSAGLATSADVTAPWVAVEDTDHAVALLRAKVAESPAAAVALVQVLRMAGHGAVEDGLVRESLAYSMLQAGPHFARWRQARPVRDRPASAAPTVLVSRSGDVLDLLLDRPDVHNAYNRRMRDELCAALTAALADPEVTVRLAGAGPSFCSGGDLDEFGTFPDPPTAHLVRVGRSPARLIAALSGRIEVDLHGACAGSGIELAAFAGKVTADPGSRMWLPELAMGLIPGAGGTVSLTRRIGRARTAWMALTGEPLDAATALEWGLVDRRSGEGR